MMLEFGDQIEQLRVAERTVIEFVEGENDAQADGHAGAETAGDGHIAFDFNLEAMRLSLTAAEKGVHRFPRHGIGGG